MVIRALFDGLFDLLTLHFHLSFFLALHKARLYIRGHKDFCSIAADRKLAFIGVVDVPSNDARSVAVPIVPKRIGEIEIEVSAILQMNFGGSYLNSGGDAVKRKLLIVVRDFE